MSFDKRFICYWEYGVPKVEEYYSPKQIEGRLRAIKELGFRVFNTDRFGKDAWFKEEWDIAFEREVESWPKTTIFRRIN